MKALIKAESEGVVLVDREKPTPGPGEVLVRIKAAALNHRDQWIRIGKYAGIRAGVILGSDGAGVVESVGSEADQHWLGKEVIINPGINWGENPAAQAKDYMILGMPVDGTFAEYTRVPADRLQEKPAQLGMEQAAALPLGGLTAYRALFVKGNLQKGEKVLINGIGGGVAQFAFRFALAAGAEVWVTSGSQDKIDYVVERGAKGGFNYKEESWPAAAREAAEGGFHLIIDSAGGDQMNQLLDTLQPAGRLVFYGATTGIPSSLNLRKIFWNQLTIQGSTMGNDQEFKEMLAFVEKHRIQPIMEEPIPFDHIMEAFNKMESGTQFGKLVVVM